MGEIIELLVIMLIIATVAFAPLAYFIHKYTQKNGQPFGETEPHGDSPSLVNDLAETAIHFVKSKLGKK
ncbi:hypothetical protein BCS42_12525 [Crenothrix sp. D3]|jgi:heme/copper-type cytochrome/quinol oxidase subunit 2|nr:hypothetical protein BCS42_12525 [Crenothrix sp. D3]